MKKAENFFGDAETRIRADERTKVLALYNKTLMKMYTLASEIMELSAAFEPPQHGAVTPTLAPDKPATKRKATAATAAQINEALSILSNVKPPDEPLTPKQIMGTWGKPFGGLKTAGAALRALVEKGLAVEVSRGKFKIAETGESDHAGEAPTAD